MHHITKIQIKHQQNWQVLCVVFLFSPINKLKKKKGNRKTICIQNIWTYHRIAPFVTICMDTYLWTHPPTLNRDLNCTRLESRDKSGGCGIGRKEKKNKYWAQRIRLGDGFFLPNKLWLWIDFFVVFSWMRKVWSESEDKKKKIKHHSVYKPKITVVSPMCVFECLITVQLDFNACVLWMC